MLIWVRQNIKWIIGIIVIPIIIFIVGVVFNRAQNKELTELNLRPYINPKDWQLEIIDKTETPVRKITSKGSVPNETIPPEEIKRIVLSIIFNNSGKSPGSIKVNKIFDSLLGDVKELENKEILIPAQSEVVELGFNIIEIYNISNSIIKFNYDLESYSDKINFHEPLKFSLECDFRLKIYNDEPIKSPSCNFVPYSDQ